MKDEDKLLVILAVIGKGIILPPGIQKFIDKTLNIDCLIKLDFPKSISDETLDLKINTEDCTLFFITHNNFCLKDLSKPKIVDDFLEKSLYSISETIIWSKGLDMANQHSNYVRQIGRIDLKYCLIYNQDKLELIWKNELMTNEFMFNIFGNLFPNMVNKNGPTSIPIPYISRRLLNTIDLINLGFYSEAFISSFSLLDDLTQEVTKYGLKKKGFTPVEQKSYLRSIKEERLKNYLTTTLKLCDWKSLEEDNSSLFNDIIKINSLRNNIVHSCKVINRDECLDAITKIIHTILWLANNPFDYVIPKLPYLTPMPVKFTKLIK